MKTTLKITSSVFALLTIAILVNPVNAFAVTQTPDDVSTVVNPINDEISLEITTTSMYIPEENSLPWGTVRGTVTDPAERYPVIIQFFDANDSDVVDTEDLVHVAQVDVKGDDTYEYQFRVLNKDLQTGQIIDIFEGKYVVKIFKVVQNTEQII